MLHIGFGSVLVQAPQGARAKFEWTKNLGGQFIEYYYEEMERDGYGDQEYALLRALSAEFALPLTYHISWHKDEDDLGRYSIEEGAAQLLKMMQPGFKIGARFLILHLGAYPGGEKRLAVLERVREIVRRVIPALEENCAVLCLENNTAIYTPGAIGVSVFEWDTLFTGLDSPHIGMCLDTGHAHVNGCLNEITRTMGKKIRYIHLHDNNGVLDSHRAPGLGSIDWASWYPMLADLPADPWVMFEYPRADGFAQTIADIRRTEEAKGGAQ